MKIVAVVGGHSNVDPAALEFGKWLARFAIHLLTGGGAGVMEAVCQSLAEVPRSLRRGWAIGVLPAESTGALKEGYPNRFVEIAIKTRLHGRENVDGSGADAPLGIHSRNHIN